MLNKITLIGNVGQDPEVKNLDFGKVANFSIATTEKYKNKAGEQIDETEWHNISAFGKLADIVELYVKKGSKLYIEGKIKSRSWEKDGVTHYAKDVICNTMKMLDAKPASNTAAPAATPATTPAAQDDFQSNNDDLPF